MFDPNKYDNSNAQNTGKSKLQELIEKRETLIKYILDMKPVILKECTSLDKQVEEDPNPDSDKVRAFKKKLDGWSRILNGADILNEMYLNKK